MTPEVLTVSPQTDVATAARLLIERGVKSLPVVERSRVVGMISRYDLISRLGEDPDFFNPMRRGR
ncbi:hypothetical protein RxyAA322_27920 [Rubrobacter xylanophilus]|uniref:CBS domain-containing protein n=1 Tax=Rubrobacter xylanophilus TaxID=49319 RepID=A0A510HM98_9ACTN|nr:CBS domain-containing protein [Rubrobacter xylanophilus]BBL80938.1 hypothetical protein RxyAA322_27920 [Rubrobacter xylanophilus]